MQPEEVYKDFWTHILWNHNGSQYDINFQINIFIVMIKLVNCQRNHVRRLCPWRQIDEALHHMSCSDAHCVVTYTDHSRDVQ